MPGSWENPTVALRFIERPTIINNDTRVVRILQQRWDVYEDGLPASTKSEWRDVPLVSE